MNKNGDSLEKIVKDMVKWSETLEGKQYINDMFFEIQEASEKLIEDVSLKPEKLKMVINV